jgi:hypothetical protein
MYGCLLLLEAFSTSSDTISVGDLDPLVFGPPGSGSISQRYGSGSGSVPFIKKVLNGLK